MDYGVDFLVLKKKINQHNSRELWPSSICDEIVWFYFEGVMMHVENTMKDTSGIIQSLLKFFSIFNISIWYDK